MTDPVWALTDMGLIKTLLQMPDTEDWEKLLKSKAKDRFLFDSFGAVVERLAQAELPIRQSLNKLAQRLNQAAIEKDKKDNSGS